MPCNSLKYYWEICNSAAPSLAQLLSGGPYPEKKSVELIEFKFKKLAVLIKTKIF